MEHLDLVLWLLLWPLCCVICRYWATKERLLYSNEKPVQAIIVVSEVLDIIIWGLIASLLYNN